jgi:hypothetical protein
MFLKIHYRQLYADFPDEHLFMPVAVSTSGRVSDDLMIKSVYYHTKNLWSILGKQINVS